MSSSGKTSLSVQKTLFLLLMVVLLPIIVIQGYFLHDRYQTRKHEELEANLELARAVGVAFKLFIQDVLHQELSIGITATATPLFSLTELSELLRRSADDHKGVRNYSLLSPEGQVLASSNPERIGMDVSDREYFREIKTGREWALSNLVESKATGEPIITIIRSIRDGEGNLLGSIVGTVPTVALEGVLAIDRAKGAGVSLLDRNGMHVARNPHTELTWDQRDWLRWYPQVDRALKGEEITAVVKSNRTGQKRLVGFVPIDSVGWVAAASRAEDDVFGTIFSTLLAQGTLFLLVTLLAFASALALSRRISRSIMKLRDHAVTLGRGEVENSGEFTSGPSEVEELAVAFNEMAGKVRAREGALLESEEFLRAIFRSTDNGIIILDEQQRCVQANPAAGTITNVPHRSLVGRFLAEFVDTGFDLKAAWPDFVRAGRFAGEVGIRNANGSLRSIEAVGVANIRPGKHLFVGHDFTERKRAHDQLKATLESIGDGFYACDGDWLLVYVNSVAEKLMGIRQEEVLGKSLWDVFPFTLGTRLETEYRQAAAGEVRDFENFFEPWGRWFHSRCFPREGGGMSVYFREITMQKRAEEALRRSEDRLRRFYNSGMVGVIYWTMDGRVTDANDKFLEMVGYDREDMEAGRIQWEEMTPPEYRHFDEHALGELAKSGINTPYEKEFIRKDGSRIPIIIGAAMLDDPPDEGVAFVLDITERKRTEEELRTNRAKLSAALGSMNDAVFITDIEGHFIDFNEAFAKFLRFKTKEECLESVAEYSKILDVFMANGERAPLNMWPVPRALRGDAVTDAEYTMRRKDTGETWTSSHTFGPIRDGDGTIVGSVVVARDITEKKRMEEALRRSRDELEVRVGERTAELERKNQELQEFAFVASHDLKEPLRKIQAFGSLLALKGSENLNEVEMDYISRMTGAANRMQELLDALLSYSRIETKGQAFRPTNLNEVAQDVAGDLEVRIRYVGAQMEFGPLPVVTGDPLQLRQLFQNLIANALKYHRSEVKPRVKIFGEEGKEICNIFVEDNGIGFDEKYLDKIFQPFQRLHGKNEYSGTGIGLAICKKIVERHGGAITARSTPGKGSTFIVTLPVK